MRPSFLLLKNLSAGRYTKAAEVGVRYGNNALVMLEKHPYLELFLIDNYQETDAPNAKDRAIERLRDFSDRAHFIFEDSIQAANRFTDGSLDYVYIDATHNYDAVKADCLAWWPKIKDTGILAGHDYSMESVKRAVKDFMDDRKILFVIDDLADAEAVDWLCIRRS